MTADGSFRELLARLRAGDDRAAGEVVRRFTHQLIGLARHHLDTVIRTKVDPEDIVQSVYKSFFRRQRDGQFDLAGWDDLWSLLAVITLRKCASQADYFRAERRNPGREVQGPAPDGSGTEWQLIDREPTPVEAAALAETVADLLREVAPADRPIIELSLQGYTVKEICEQLGRAERTVWRVRERARNRLRRRAAAP
jgi:RNA polymerase sigma-70 factor (ECF subfamily)